MIDRTCNYCKLTLPIEQFYVRREGGRPASYYGRCIECTRALSAQSSAAKRRSPQYIESRRQWWLDKLERRREADARRT